MLTAEWVVVFSFYIWYCKNNCPLSILWYSYFIYSKFVVSSYIQDRKNKNSWNFKGIKSKYFKCFARYCDTFWSCSSIPIFRIYKMQGFLLDNIFLLISSPLVDLGSFILLISVFGLPIAAIYVIVGLILAVIGGTILDKMGMEKCC